VDVLLRRQWESLHDWLGLIEVEKHNDVPTGLGTWTVADLVAHVGLGLGLAAEVSVAADGPEVRSIGEYVAAYRGAASDIAAMTENTRAALGADPLGGLNEVAERVWSALSRCRGELVAARRGTMRRSDYLVTRLIELVVHGDDLWRVLGVGPSPVLPEALGVVGDALTTAYRERCGVMPEPFEHLTWVRVACGRLPSDDPVLPLL
jgi:uncharacterized protein (TIGR03083 family)